MARPVEYYTHVNRGIIDSNRKHGRDDPIITIKKGRHKVWAYASEVELPPGSRMIYSAHEPLLQCGARCVIISPEAPTIIS